MANMTAVTNVMLLCVILFSSTHGENDWKDQLRKRISRGLETSDSFRTSFKGKPQSTRRLRTTINNLLKTTLLVANNPSSSFTNFQTEAQDQTNAYRAVHCAPNLNLNSTICADAQAYANQLAITGIMQHSNNPAYGENLYSFSSSQPVVINSVNGSVSVSYWYNEMNQYNWNAATFSSSTGHFTQLVWKSTTQFGIGIACQSDYRTCFVVANYWLPGNVLGQFQDNVKRPGSCA